MLLRQQPQPQILRDIGVLVLIDQHIAEAMLIGRENVGIVLEQRQIVQQQIPEIDRVHRREALLVEPVEVDRAAIGEVADLRRRDFVRGEPAVFPALDDRVQYPRRPAPFVDMGGGEDLLHEAQLVVGIENREARFEPDRLGMASEDAGGERMEGAEPYALGSLADHRLEALTHLARRLVGESDRQHLAGIGAAGREDVREPGGQYPRLAGAGAGQHQHRSVDRGDGLRLRLVQRSEIGLRLRGRGWFGKKLGHRPII